MYKICIKCGTDAVIDDYYKNKTTIGGYENICKECHDFCSKQYYLKNKEEVRLYKHQHYLNNKQKYIDRASKWKKNNKDKTIKSHREYNRRNKDNLRKWRKSFALFDTYANQLSCAEEVRYSMRDKSLLEVKCTYCGKWYSPTNSSVQNRISYIEDRGITGENRLYCSMNCKQECSIFNQTLWPKDFKPSTSREVQPELRQMVFKRDNWICQICDEDKSLHCHHITGVEQNPIESADVDNCITLCKKCHKWVHTKEGCKYHELRRCI